MAKKQGLNRLRLKLISVAVASCFVTGTALANPTGPAVVNGTANIQGLGTNLLQINNTPNAIINWQSFSIGANEITRFIQQSQASAVLNRVTGSAGVIDPSVILGALQSNGRVLLINPSGIVFGAGAQIDVAGLVASSLNLSNADFLANRLKFTDMPGAGSVVNQGNINTGSGGSVYLVGPAVTNSGIITSPQGEVVLAAGNSVELVSPGTPNLRVEITAPDNQAVNLGQVVADAGRVGIYAGLINNSGTIRASSAVAEGGRILLKGTKAVTLESTSILDASGAGGGTIEVLSRNGGTVNVAGRLDASAPNSGDGGFIETSADLVKVSDSTVVTTAASNGKSGMWLIDPTNFSIVAGTVPLTGSGIGADILQTSLGSTDVTIATLAYGGEVGDINVNSSVSWDSAFGLTLIAHADVNVNNSITNAGTGGINLYAGWDGVNSANPAVISCCSGTINLLAPITTFGTAVLVAGAGITQDASGVITAASLLAKAGFVGVNLDGAVNNVGTLAGTAEGSFRFKNGSSLIVGSVASGNTAIGTIDGIASTGSNEVEITVTSGNLTVNQDILAAGGNSNNASITLDAQNSLTVNNSLISAQGNPGEGDGNATVALIAQTGNITLNSSTVEAVSDIGCCGTGRDATVSMDAAGAITLNNSNVIATGGSGSSPGGAASAVLNAGGNIQITGSSIQVAGGTGGSGSSFGGQGGSASVSVTSTSGSISVTNGTISLSGGAAYGGSFASGGGANAQFQTSGPVSFDNSTVIATGGNGFAGGSAGSAQVFVDAGTGISLVNGSSITTVAGTAGDLGWSEISLDAAGGNIVLNNSTLSASGRLAFVVLDAFGAGGEVQLQSNTTLNATGADGAEGAIFASKIAVVSSAINVTGNDINGSNATLNMSADIGGISMTGSTIDVTSTNNSANAFISADGNIALNGTAINVQSNNNAAYGGAFADSGPAQVSVFSSAGINMDSGSSISVATGNAGSGNNFSGGSASASASTAQAFLQALNGITMDGTITATGGNGGSASAAYGGTANASGGDAFVGLFSGGGVIAANGTINASGGDGGSASSATGNAFAGGGTANIVVTGTAVNLLASGSLNSTGGGGTPVGRADVEINSLGNVTLGGNITTSGENPLFSDDGIAISAGGAIIGTTTGVLDAQKAAGASNFPVITLNAVNGIGTIAAPVRIQDGSEATGPEMFFNNSSLTTGDIAVSFVSGNVEIVNDLGGLLNNNATGTYSINVENGNFLLATAFEPSFLALAAGQDVSITTPNGDITFGDGARLITSGGGTITASGTNINVLADAAQAFVKSSGLMTVNATGALTVQGGAGANTFAQLVSDGGQNISAATINLTGGSGGTGNSARIANTAGVQTISGSPNITLTGGSGGLADQGNFAQIFSGGSQNITAGNVTIAAGTGGGFNNFANIVSPLQAITVNGNLSLTGGNSQASATSGGGARIGGLGGATPSATNLVLNVTGDVTLTGGSVANAGAGIGSNFNGGQTTAITINAGGDVTLNPGSVSGARIGSPTANVAGGNITVVAGGNLALNSAAGVGTSIATTGNITLQGSSVTSTGTLNGALVNAAATAGNISLTQSSGIALGLLSSSGTVTVNSGGAISDGNGGANIIAPSASLSGAGGVGSIANPLETQVGAIALSGGGEIGIINNGSFTLSGLSGGASNVAIYASTQFGAPSASLSLGGPVSVSGNLSLLSDSGMTVDKNVSAGGALVLDGGAGDLDILPGAGNTMVQSGGATLLKGTNVHLGHASQTTNLDVIGGSGLGIISAGELTVQGGDGGYTFARSNSGNLAINTIGNVTVSGGTSGGFAHVLGSPDVVMSVGGTVQFNATDPTAPARIESALPSTIHLDFTTLTSGGYFVNGVEGVTADPDLGTGFYADGVPAVLDQNLLITYGGVGVVAPSVPGVEQAVNQVIASTNQTTTITEDEPIPLTSDGGTTEGDIKDKKDLPVCK